MSNKPHHNRQSTSLGKSTSLISKVFLENTGFLKKFLGRFLSERQDIEDVVQETYLRAYNAEQHNRSSGEVIDYPKAFLFKIAKNLALTELSKKSRRITDYIDDIEHSLLNENGASTEEELEAREHIDIICAAVTAMPERRQRVYLMRKVHGASHREIAETLGISISAVEKHLLNAMLACRDHIRRHEQEQQMARQPLQQEAGTTPGQRLRKKDVSL